MLLPTEGENPEVHPARLWTGVPYSLHALWGSIYIVLTMEPQALFPKLSHCPRGCFAGASAGEQKCGSVREKRMFFVIVNAEASIMFPHFVIQVETCIEGLWQVDSSGISGAFRSYL